eukprot:1227979-Amorphochlora_amoeboformis.AAC.1
MQALHRSCSESRRRKRRGGLGEAYFNSRWKGFAIRVVGKGVEKLPGKAVCCELSKPIFKTLNQLLASLRLSLETNQEPSQPILNERQEGIRDGTITISELGVVLKSLKKNFNEQQLKEIIKKVDKNGDGQIDFEEFLKMMSNRVGTRNRDYELKEAFNVFDQDGDGYITASELSTVMKTLGEQIDKETIDLMIEGVDRDGDGEIDFNGNRYFFGLGFHVPMVALGLFFGYIDVIIRYDLASIVDFCFSPRRFSDPSLPHRIQDDDGGGAAVTSIRTLYHRVLRRTWLAEF